MVERSSLKTFVVGSNPARRTIFILCKYYWSVTNQNYAITNHSIPHSGANRWSSWFYRYCGRGDWICEDSVLHLPRPVHRELFLLSGPKAY